MGERISDHKIHWLEAKCPYIFRVAEVSYLGLLRNMLKKDKQLERLLNIPGMHGAEIGGVMCSWTNTMTISVRTLSVWHFGFDDVPCYLRSVGELSYLKFRTDFSLQEKIIFKYLNDFWVEYTYHKSLQSTIHSSKMRSEGHRCNWHSMGNSLFLFYKKLVQLEWERFSEKCRIIEMGLLMRDVGIIWVKKHFSFFLFRPEPLYLDSFSNIW